LTDVVLLLPP